MKYIYISIGGAIGAASRYYLGNQLVTPVLHTGDFPYTTFFINLMGSFLLGFMSMYFYKNRGTFYAAATTGFLGGFTTFSAFSLEAFTLLEYGFEYVAFLYISASVIGGIFCALLAGFIATKLEQ